VRGKPRKRPPKASVPVVTGLQGDLVAGPDAWIGSHGLPSRPEAVRHILRQVLKRHRSLQKTAGEKLTPLSAAVSRYRHPDRRSIRETHEMLTCNLQRNPR
jgi:metal-responsive CopG/Arc/MetJ family transcriptional regulator